MLRVTSRALQRAGERSRKADAAKKAAEEQRDALVQRAFAEGWPQKQIAEAIGLSVPRVSQISRPRK